MVTFSAAISSQVPLHASLQQWASVASRLLSAGFPDVHVGRRAMSQYASLAVDCASFSAQRRVAIAASLKSCCQVSVAEMLSGSIDVECSLTVRPAVDG